MSNHLWFKINSSCTKCQLLQERNLTFVHAVQLWLKSVFFSPVAVLYLETIARPVHTERQPLPYRQVFDAMRDNQCRQWVLKGLFTLNGCVCVNVTVKVYHCVNSNANIDEKKRFRSILWLCICITIDTMLNFNSNVDANADVKCEQSINTSIWFRLWLWHIATKKPRQLEVIVFVDDQCDRCESTFTG